jgi:hypothetical protein
MRNTWTRSTWTTASLVAGLIAKIPLLTAASTLGGAAFADALHSPIIAVQQAWAGHAPSTYFGFATHKTADALVIHARIFDCESPLFHVPLTQRG